MVSTSDKKFYNISLAVRSHGWARDVQDSFKKNLEKKFKIDEFKSLYTFYFSGLNVRSTDFNANIGLRQLKKINKISLIRHKNYIRYRSKLESFWSQSSDLRLISNFGYATFVKNRLEVYKYLKSKNIQTRPLICGNMGQQPFLKSKNIIKKNLISANFIDRNGIYLPNHANLSLTDVDYISGHFNKVAEPIFF